MTSANASVLAAARRGDFGWLCAHLNARTCTPEVARLLGGHDDPRMRHLGLTQLEARIVDSRTPESELIEAARLLPQAVDGPPETALVLARLHERLWRHVSPQHRPRWRAVDLPARVRIAWLRAEIVNEPAVIRDQPRGELLYQVVAGITIDHINRPEELIRELIAGGDHVLHSAALRLAREGLQGALLAPGRVREILDTLLNAVLDASPPAVVCDVLRELAEPWAALAPLAPHRLRPFLAGDSRTSAPTVTDAAIEVAIRHRHGDLLWDVITAERTPPRTRQRALAAVGELAGRGDISAITAVAATDPLLFGASAIESLRALHRRGLFPSGADAAAIVDIALADHTVPAVEAATIMFTCRHEAFRALMVDDAGDPSWPRRLALVVDLAAHGRDLPAGDAAARMLPSAPHPEWFLAAIRALGHRAAEPAVLEALPQAPEAALHTLEVIGGPLTVDVLREQLGLAIPHDGGCASGVVAPHLRGLHTRALELLWHLTDDPDQRHEILDRLNPRDLPGRIRADLGAPDPRETALLAAADVGTVESAEATLLALARSADAAAVPIIVDLLARIVADLALSQVPDKPTPGYAGAAQRRHRIEPAVPMEIANAIYRLGCGLHDRGKLRPVCVGEASTAAAAGHALVATIGLDLIERPGLSDGELAIVLAMLQQAPYAGARARVHRLLRHRDRHVRKHAIAAIVASDGTDDGTSDGVGEGTAALSASLIGLTTVHDGQTVRQALLALGRIRARWAAAAIAACLDHPTMNVKKTAAETLIHAGAPVAVPKLLFWLARHDNPGLRAGLIEALRTILGDAFTATVIATAEDVDDRRSCELLLAGIGQMPSARAVIALAEQGSPSAPMLLSLVAAGRVTLGCGTIDDLAPHMAAHGITPPPASTPSGGDEFADDVALMVDGWDDAAALRVAQRLDQQMTCPTEEQRTRLRSTLAHWLRLAEVERSARRAILRSIFRICPEPWSKDELTAFRQSIQLMLAELPHTLGADRDDLFGVLEAVAPALSAGEAFDVTIRIRALSSETAGRRPPLELLRRCGAVLTRVDIEQALLSARRGADPWPAEADVLRDAFSVAQRPATEQTLAWRCALEAAVRAPTTLRAFRAEDDSEIPSRDRLSVLIDVFTSAHREARDALLDWMEALAPLDAPLWTLAEDSRRNDISRRLPDAADLDQPRSIPQRERLLTMLDASEKNERDAAAVALRDWPEAGPRRAVLRAFLRGRVTVPVTSQLAGELGAMGETELWALVSGVDDTGRVHDRLATVVARLTIADLRALTAQLLTLWERGTPALRASIADGLRRDPDRVAELLRPQLAAGKWGYLDLITHGALLRTPELIETCRRLRAEGRNDLADSLTLVDGPLREPDAANGDVDALAALRERPVVTTVAVPGQSRRELLDLIRGGQTEQIRLALTRVAESYEDNRSRGERWAHDDQSELESLLADLLRHSAVRIRLHSHRIGRRVLDRPTYLRHASVLLDDPETSVVRMAIATLCHAAHKPAMPAIVALLTHPHPAIRSAAADGLRRVGQPAIPALRHAASRARPDKRSHFAAVLDQIQSDVTGPATMRSAGRAG